ncbi:hypothetical protein [Flavobacterium sp. IMCC34518]|uniref:hypothetical protein n=1 Tax=Flavobacterium sp. IMCC34518 TaxID=3003623 RepID=UPI0022ABFDF0|nr:hypothetical protein [Flavobacterium sp. IMCC34518]
MKKQTGIWIDSSKAIIVTLDGEKQKISEIESNLENKIYHEKEGSKGTFNGSHHGSDENKFDKKRKNETNQFLKNILSNIKLVDELYIFGPAETKIKLEQKINTDKSFDSSKLKLVENAESNLTTNQIVAKVKKFYH